MTQDMGRGPIEEIRDVLVGEAAAVEGFVPVPEADMMNVAEGPMDADVSPVDVPVEEQSERPATIEVDDDWGMDAESRPPDYDFTAGDPHTNDLTDADPDARPGREAETQPDIGRVE